MAGLAQGQPIEVRVFGVTGSGLAGPPSLANPQMRLRTGSLLFLSLYGLDLVAMVLDPSELPCVQSCLNMCESLCQLFESTSVYRNAKGDVVMPQAWQNHRDPKRLHMKYNCCDPHRCDTSAAHVALLSQRVRSAV